MKLYFLSNIEVCFQKLGSIDGRPNDFIVNCFAFVTAVCQLHRQKRLAKAF